MITDIEGEFDLSPFIQITDTIILKHVGMQMLLVSVDSISHVIVMPEKIEELQNVYVTDIGPKEIFKKAIINTQKLTLRTSYSVSKGYQQVVEEGLIIDSLVFKDSTLQQSAKDEVYKFLGLAHGATDLDYLDDYFYDLIGFYSNGMVIEQRMKGLRDRFHFKYFINDDFQIEQLYFQYDFDVNKRYDFYTEVMEKYLWKGNVQFEIDRKVIRPVQLLLEEHYVYKPESSSQKSNRYQISFLQLQKPLAD